MNRKDWKKDYGPEPYAGNIRCMAARNSYYRRVFWTGNHLQVTLMCIPAGRDIGLEIHEDLDQIIFIESGYACVCMGNCRNSLDFRKKICSGDAVMVPSGTWHNIVNRGSRPLKLYSVYAPPQHPYGALHLTKENAEYEERMEKSESK